MCLSRAFLKKVKFTKTGDVIGEFCSLGAVGQRDFSLNIRDFWADFGVGVGAFEAVLQ